MFRPSQRAHDVAAQKRHEQERRDSERRALRDLVRTIDARRRAGLPLPRRRFP